MPDDKRGLPGEIKALAFGSGELEAGLHAAHQSAQKHLIETYGLDRFKERLESLTQAMSRAAAASLGIEEGITEDHSDETMLIFCSMYSTLAMILHSIGDVGVDTTIHDTAKRPKERGSN